jgi:iron complex outermembrane receptor protein
MTGKLALRYQPRQRLVFRGAVSNGFRAPGLGQVHFSKVVTNFIAGVPEEIGIYPVDNPVSRLLGSKDLKEETSLNFSGGAAVTPMNGLTFTADYFNIKIDNRIILGATFDDDTVKAILARNGYTGIGGVQYFTNGLDTRTQGVDFTADWHVPMQGKSALEVIGAVNYTKNEITHVDPLPAVLSTSTEPGLLDVVTRVAIEKERPDWRATLTGDYGFDKVHALARISYYGGFSSAQPGYCDACEESYGAKTLVDAEGGYRFPMIDWTLGARNLFDTYPDHPKLDFNNNFRTFPWAAASPFGYNGRYLYTKVSFVGPSR